MRDCPYCGFPVRRRRVGCDAAYVIDVCGCKEALIECWRELLRVMDALQRERPSARREVAA